MFVRTHPELLPSYLNNIMFTRPQVTAKASKGKCERGLINLNLQFFEVVSCFTLIGFICFISSNSTGESFNDWLHTPTPHRVWNVLLGAFLV